MQSADLNQGDLIDPNPVDEEKRDTDRCSPPADDETGPETLRTGVNPQKRDEARNG